MPERRGVEGSASSAWSCRRALRLTRQPALTSHGTMDSSMPIAAACTRLPRTGKASPGRIAMRLGYLLRYAGLAGGPPMEHVLEAERLGYHSVWCGEAYGNDAVSPIAWVLARTTKINAGTGIMQMSARTPACAAATAATLQSMSGNRFLMGIGP